ncbi:N-acyl-D-amino-acid deacylase family protein [Kordiimonas sp.]|uniref:N-acyl-D-amino-acid deacylase family protein n=2 Tax=Kordiimonas sp. TaxID=1970157 RepID=UPI003A8D57D2
MRLRFYHMPAVLCVLFLAACEQVTAAPSSWVIDNVVIVDGKGSPKQHGSVRVNNGIIEAVGSLTFLAGEQIIDGEGLVLAPGFIDTHSHHDADMEQRLDAVAATSQGITTIVLGQDGFSNYPLVDFYQRRGERPAAVNIASYIGHNSLRASVMGENYKRVATPGELSEMQDLLVAEMAAGGLGLSTGLEYDPGIYSDANEIMTLAQTTASLGGRYISHIRSEDRQLFQAVDEIITIGRETGMAVQISHIKLAMKSLWGRADELIERLDSARSEGVDISADIYPYEYWASNLSVLLPERNFDDRAAIQFALSELVPPDGLILVAFAADPSFVGKSLAQIAEERAEDPIDTYIMLLKKSEKWQHENPHSDQITDAVMGRSMATEDIVTLLKWDHTNLCTDGAHIGHPRGVGSYPRVLGRYVREDGALSLEEAVRKMTSVAAKHVGITDRGVIAPGYVADLVLFDAETIIDKATYQDRSRQSEGVVKVWVNGELTFRNDKPTGARAGKLIKKLSDQPVK